MEFHKSLYFSSRKLNQKLEHMADDAFSGLNFASSSYVFLLMMVAEHPGMQPVDLSEQLQLTASTITRLVKKMEEQGYLKRESEGRSIHLELTEQGKEIYPRLKEAWDALEKQYVSALGERYTKVLAELARKGVEQIEAEQEED